MWWGRAREGLVHVRYGYWFDAVMGLILVTVPLVGALAREPRVLYVGFAVGVSLLAWAIITYLHPGIQDIPRKRASHV
jgi:hypothetical protein